MGAERFPQGGGGGGGEPGPTGGDSTGRQIWAEKRRSELNFHRGSRDRLRFVIPGGGPSGWRSSRRAMRGSRGGGGNRSGGGGSGSAAGMVCVLEVELGFPS